MVKAINLVKKFHKKFKVPILKNPSLIKKDRSSLRYKLMREEVRVSKWGPKWRFGEYRTRTS